MGGDLDDVWVGFIMSGFLLLVLFEELGLLACDGS